MQGFPTRFAVLTLAASAAVLVAIACSTPDPRAGARRVGSSSSSGGSSSGGIDAAVPEAPLDCGPAPGRAAPFTKQALLSASVACAKWQACHFQNAAVSLRTSARDYAASPNETTLSAARTAWKAAMDAWSKNELFQFGPVGSRSADPYHGRGLRSFVHPWPDTNRCQVEAQVASRGWETRGIESVLPGARGLYALEYLFFYPGVDTACLPASNTGQAWGALGAADLVKSKADYAAEVADNLVALALEVRSVWSPEGENFGAKLLAFDGYGTEQEALNVVAWSLFYIHTELKDFKLASPAGVTTAPPNPETPFAHVEIDNVRTNLRAFRSLFDGCSADGSGLGFDDWLTAVGAQQLLQDIHAATTNIETAAAAFPTFGQATPAQFAEFYRVVKVLSDLLKTSFFGSASPLNLKLPATAASDTD